MNESPEGRDGNILGGGQTGGNDTSTSWRDIAIAQHRYGSAERKYFCGVHASARSTATSWRVIASVVVVCAAFWGIVAFGLVI